MKDFVIYLSLTPMIISAMLLGFLIFRKMINYKTILLVIIMAIISAMFFIFIKYFYTWNTYITLTDTVASSYGLMLFFVVLFVSAGIKGNRFSFKNVLSNIKSFNFSTVSLLVFVGVINLILFIANVVRYTNMRIY